MVTEAKVIKVEPISTEIAVRAQQEAPAMLKQAEAVVILTQEHYEGANDALKAVKNKFKEFEAMRKKGTKPLNEAKQVWMDLFRTPLEILAKAESILKQAMITYAEEQDRVRREEQRKLELKAKAEEDRKRKILEARAKKWANKGNDAKAEELQEQAEEVHVEAPVIAPVAEKPKGVSYREQWSAKVTDEAKVPREYLIVNIQALNRVAQATKGALKIAGVEWKCEKILSSRGA